MIDKQRGMRSYEASRGFTLLGVLVSMALIALLAGSVLQSTALLRHHFDRVVVHRRKVLEKWNASRRLRLQKTPSVLLIVTLPGARPLYRHHLANDGLGWSWEVWVGEY